MGNMRSLLVCAVALAGVLTLSGTAQAICTVKGNLYYNDNTTGMLATSSPAIQVFFNNGTGTTQLPSSKISLSLPNYTITIAPSDIPAGATDLTVTIKYLVNGSIDRVMSGILAN